jgi:acyl-CoA thioesterase FadM
VGVNIRYKSPAKVYDNMVIETECMKFSSQSATFKQVIKSKATGKPFVEAEVEVVATSTASGKLYRRLPAKLADAFVELGVSS